MPEPLRLWIDDRQEAPDGWLRATASTEVIDLLSAGGVGEISLGGSPGLIEACAQGIELGASAGRIRQVKAVVHAEAGTARDLAERALANAAKHWASPPVQAQAKPSAKPTAKRRPGATFMRFIAWHLLGFALAIAVFEAWCLLRHGTHAPIIAWALALAR